MMDWIRRRWQCFREGHIWSFPDLPGPDVCVRCGKLVEW